MEIYSRKISTKALEVLKNMKAYTVMPLPVEITDEVYDEVAAVLRTLGGTWLEQRKAFCFSSDPSKKLREVVETGVFFVSEEALHQEEFQQYYTDGGKATDAAKRVVEWCEIEDHHIVLEPSAGQAGLAQWLPNRANVVAVEIDPRNVAKLKEMGFGQLIWSDFMKVSGLLVDRVVMNPPFSGFQDVKHVCHALDMLKIGGILVAIINENTLYRSEHPECKPYMDRIRSYQPEFITLEEGTFAESGTMIRTVVLKIRKSH